MSAHPPPLCSCERHAISRSRWRGSLIPPSRVGTQVPRLWEVRVDDGASMLQRHGWTPTDETHEQMNCNDERTDGVSDPTVRDEPALHTPFLHTT